MTADQETTARAAANDGEREPPDAGSGTLPTLRELSERHKALSARIDQHFQSLRSSDACEVYASASRVSSDRSQDDDDSS
ncbi:hypothetical protein [Streptomyces specialis]|uniref:hypothetical protein n=1 Tax=Streptomyces specialis TaxID=498367 RepID=UPI00131C18F9|nr:hypothetical protein [Streptomyces specialis]